MAVSQLQFNTTSTGSTPVTSFSVTQGSPGAIGNTLVAVLVTNNGAPASVTPNWTLIATSGGSSPYMFVYRFTAISAVTQTFGVTFSTNTLASLAMITTNATSVSGVTFATGSGNSTLTAQGTTPPYWAPKAGDLPYGFFASSSAATPSTQSGWTQIANLNSTAGQSAQLQVQEGPVTTTTPQSPTATTTWTGAAGFASVGALITLSSAGPYSMTTQEYPETISQGTPKSRTTQAEMDVVSQGIPKSHTSQMFLDTLSQDTAQARSSQIYMELIVPLVVRTTQEYAEVLSSDTAKVRVSQAYMEVLFSSQSARRRTLDDEWFTF